MARRPRPMVIDREPTCSRSQYLDEQEQYRAAKAEAERCWKINTKPGYETLANMKYNRG